MSLPGSAALSDGPRPFTQNDECIDLLLSSSFAEILSSIEGANSTGSLSRPENGLMGCREVVVPIADCDKSAHNEAIKRSGSSPRVGLSDAESEMEVHVSSPYPSEGRDLPRRTRRSRFGQDNPALRPRPSALFLDSKDTDWVAVNQMQDHRRKEIARVRWMKAIWWATEEAHRRRAESRVEHNKIIKVSALAAAQHWHRMSLSRHSIDLQNVASPMAPWRTLSFTEGHDQEQGSFKLSSRQQSLLSSLDVVLSCLGIFALIYLLFVWELYIILSEGVPIVWDILAFSLAAACFCVFLADLVMGFSANPAFRWTSHMWLELAVLLSLVPDLVVLALLTTGHPDANARRLLYVLRLWRGAGTLIRSGTRASRTLRVLKLLSRAKRLASGVWRVRRANTVAGCPSPLRGTKVVADCSLPLTTPDGPTALVPDGEDQELQDDGMYTELLGSSSIGHELDHVISAHLSLLVGLMLLLGLAYDSVVSTGAMDASLQPSLQLVAAAAATCGGPSRVLGKELVDSFAAATAARQLPLLFLQVCRGTDACVRV